MAVSLVVKVTRSNSKLQVRKLKGQARQHKQCCRRTVLLHLFIRQNLC